jgi:hemoglobin
MRRMLFICLLLSACSAMPAREQSLYQRLGEQAGLTRIVEGMLLNIAKDPRIVGHFANVDISLLRDKLVQQLCVETGGPCQRTGDSMQEVHKGLQLTRSDFNALVEDLIAAMEEQGVPVPTQNLLLALLAPMRGQIIEL